MRIVSFIPRHEAVEAVGLVRVRLERLGQLVLLAGPNGGGKSRVLELLQQANAAAGGNRLSARRNASEERENYSRAIAERAAGRRSEPDEVVAQWTAIVEGAEARLSALDSIHLDQEVTNV